MGLYLIAEGADGVEHDCTEKMLCRWGIFYLRTVFSRTGSQLLPPPHALDRFALNIFPKRLPLAIRRPNILTLEHGDDVTALGFKQVKNRTWVALHGYDLTLYILVK